MFIKCINFIQELFMKAQLEGLLKDMINPSSSFAYGVPLQWWDQFCASNNNATQLDDLKFPELKIEKYWYKIVNASEQFLFEYLPYIIEELEHKSNYLKFSRVFVSPMRLPDTEWKMVSTELWGLINKKLKNNSAYFTYFDLENPLKCHTTQKIQIQIIFCSKNASQLFIGYFPPDLALLELVRALSYEMGFIEMLDSRLTYPDKNKDKVYCFNQLEGVKLENMTDTLIMAYNMQQKQIQLDEITFKIDNMVNSSIEAVHGDLGIMTNQSWDNIMNNRTMSTGAQTPSLLWSEEDNGEFRVKQLFRERKPEQIEQMKIYAQKCIKGEMIELPSQEEEQLQKNLQLIAQQMIEYAGMHKKKALKDKEFFYETN